MPAKVYILPHLAAWRARPERKTSQYQIRIYELLQRAGSRN